MDVLKNLFNRQETRLCGQDIILFMQSDGLRAVRFTGQGQPDVVQSRARVYDSILGPEVHKMWKLGYYETMQQVQRVNADHQLDSETSAFATTFLGVNLSLLSSTIDTCVCHSLIRQVPALRKMRFSSLSTFSGKFNGLESAQEYLNRRVETFSRHNDGRGYAIVQPDYSIANRITREMENLGIRFSSMGAADDGGNVIKLGL